MTCIAAVLIGVAVGIAGAAVIMAVTLWAAAALSGRYAKLEKPLDE